MSAPRLTFYCELPEGPLARLFDERAGLVETLAAMRAGVSVGLLDLSDERAEVVRRLVRAGVRVSAWMLLPYDDGYFQHVENALASEARFDALHAWSAREGLAWDAIGLDIEPDRRELERIPEAPWQTARLALRRVLDRARLRRGLDAYRALVERIKRTGLPVESYQVPVIADDRRAGTQMLSRAVGMMDLPVDREVWMLYSSILPFGPAWLASYGREAPAIAIGSTGGGIDPYPPLQWDALRRDLLLARRFTDDLYVFSLEGCVEQDLLPRIAALDWTAAIEREPELVRAGRRADAVRAALSATLRVGSRLGRLASRE